MGRRIRLFALGWVLVIVGGLLAHLVQTANHVRFQNVSYRGAQGERLAARLYRPASATPAHPAPAVLISHGYINTREMQTPYAIELARRGFVVLAIDMSGHGASGGWVGADDGGGPAGLRYLQSLPFVDRRNIGLEGHSMGGVPVMGAAISQPDGYRSMVLEGSTTPEPGQVGEGDARFPRNLEVVFGKWDQFAPLMWKAPGGASVAASAKLVRLFGASGPVTPGRLYGSIAGGSARLLLVPPVDHPMEPFSSAGVGAAVDWFQRTLSGEAAPRPADDQIWLWKEIGSLLGLIGFGCVVLGTLELLLETPVFGILLARAGEAQSGVADKPTLRWWVGLLLGAAIPAASYFALMSVGYLFLPSQVFPQWVTNQIVVWALVNALVGLVIGAVLGRRRNRRRGGQVKTVALAVACVAMGYLSLVVSLSLFGADFRFWVVALRPLDGARVLYALAYLPAFLVAFWVMIENLSLGLLPSLRSWWAQYTVAKLSLAGGFMILLTVQYLSLLTGGRLLWPSQALTTIIAIQFVPLLAFCGVVATFAWRRTGGHAAGGLICALIVTWYVVSGTAVHWRPGWTLQAPAGLFPARPATAATPAAPPAAVRPGSPG